MKADILKISEVQARILLAIAYCEVKLGIKGATQYSCTKKVPNGLHVSGSTFNDNIKDLEKNQMVRRLKEINKGDRKIIPFTITDIGQVAWMRHNTLTKNIDQDTWLRHDTLTKNIEIIQQIFPDIQLSVIDDIIDKIDHPYIKYINKFSIGVLKVALDSFYIEESNVLQGYKGKLVKERIELSADDGYLETSFTRWYSVVNPILFKKLSKDMTYYTENFDELKISVMDRITFLFYYNLIQLVTDSSYQMIFSKITSVDTFLDKISNDERIIELQSHHDKINSEVLKNLEELQREVVKKRKVILKIITSNAIVNKIIQDNLKDIGKHKNRSFHNISKMFIKN